LTTYPPAGGKGANSIPTGVGTDKSDSQLRNIYTKYLKAHLIYRVSFFYGFPASKCHQASSFFPISSLVVVAEKVLRPDK
jgi:hypothetical protein